MDETEQIARQLFSDLKRDFGLTDAQAAGVVGNLLHESGGFQTLQEEKPLVPGSAGGYGYAQWTGPRRRAFEDFVAENGLDPTSYDANYGFLKEEIENNPYEREQFFKVSEADTAEEAARSISENYLRPGIPHMDSRVAYAKNAMGYAGQPAPPGATPKTAPTPAPVSQRPRMVAPRPVTMSPALRKRRAQAPAEIARPPSAERFADDIGQMPSWADMNAFANNDSDIPKYVTTTMQVAPREGSSGHDQPVLKTVQRLNPDWVQAQQAAAKTASAATGPTAAEFGEQIIGGVRQAIGLPAEGLGPSIRGAVLDAFGLGPDGFKVQRELGLGNGLQPGDRRYDPSTNTWVVKPDASPARQMRQSRPVGSNATGLNGGGQGLYHAGGFVYAARPGGGYQKVGKVGQPVRRSSSGSGGSSSGGGGGGTSGLRPGDRRYNASTNSWEIK